MDADSSGVQRLELQVEQKVEAASSFFYCTLYRATMHPAQEVEHVPNVETRFLCPRAY